MKTDIYTLLGMIKDGKAPKRILFRDRQWEYSEAENDYVSIFDEWLFDEYVTTDILNGEVTILETTITYKPDKIEKLERVEDFKFAKLIDKLNEIIEKVNNL